jgi:hypothetical protein
MSTGSSQESGGTRFSDSSSRLQPKACSLPASAQWESNPHFRHGKAAGYRYIMGAKLHHNQIVKDRSSREAVDWSLEEDQ